MVEKFIDFFDPNKINAPIHIIGCGAIGSTLAIMLTRCGIKEATLWDFDTVVSHNLANQQYMHKQIGQDKTTALANLMRAINPSIHITEMGKWDDDMLAGFVFIAVDSIDVRKALINKCLGANLVMDFRMRVSDAQHYAYRPMLPREVEIFNRGLDFTQEEADQATPINGCGLTESIMPTVASVVSLGVANFINYLNTDQLHTTVVVNPFQAIIL